MKLIYKNLAICLIVLTLIISQTLESKSNMRMKTRSKNRMRTSNLSKFYSQLWQAPGSPKPKEQYLESDIKANYGEDFSKIVAESWLSVSSPEFKNEIKFPVIPTPGSSAGESLVSPEYMRINEKYQDRPVNMNTAEKFNADPDAPPKRTLFWFRLSDKYLYFAESKKCINILGSFRWIDNTLAINRIDNRCFELVKKNGAHFTYCGEDSNVMKKFLCHIQLKLRLEIDPICKTHAPDGKIDAPTKPSKLVEKVITQPFILIPMAQTDCNDDWNYKEHGGNWECLCKEGIY